MGRKPPTVLGDQDDAYTADNEEAAGGNDEYVSVPVRLVGVSSVRSIALVSGSSRKYLVPAGQATLICGEDPRRGRVTIVVNDGEIELADTANGLGFGHYGTVSDAMVGGVVFQHREAIYAAGAGAADSVATVSVFTENWAV